MGGRSGPYIWYIGLPNDWGFSKNLVVMYLPNIVKDRWAAVCQMRWREMYLYEVTKMQEERNARDKAL